MCSRVLEGSKLPAQLKALLRVQPKESFSQALKKIHLLLYSLQSNRHPQGTG